jgi:hypothetical protein
MHPKSWKVAMLDWKHLDPTPNAWVYRIHELRLKCGNYEKALHDKMVKYLIIQGARVSS